MKSQKKYSEIQTYSALPAPALDLCKTNHALCSKTFWGSVKYLFPNCFLLVFVSTSSSFVFSTSIVFNNCAENRETFPRNAKMCDENLDACLIVNERFQDAAHMRTSPVQYFSLCDICIHDVTIGLCTGIFLLQLFNHCKRYLKHVHTFIKTDFCNSKT